MSFEFLQFWTRETGANIVRNRLMSLVAVSTVTIGLFILGAFYIAISNLQTTVAQTAQKLDLVAILQPGIKSKRRLEIYNAARIPQVADLQIVLAAAALKEYRRLYSDLPLDDFEKNPIGDELRIKLKNPDDLFKVRAYLETIKGVKHIRNDQETDKVARKILDAKKVLTWAGGVALLVLGLGILLIIHNAIRLTVAARQREIRIMQLVGATPGFIRVPFLLEGTFYGVVGAFLSVLALGPFYFFLRGFLGPLRELMPLEPGRVLGPCMVLMVGAGLVFGILGSWISFGHSQKTLQI